MRSLRHGKGFTLIELLIVIAIFTFVIAGVTQMTMGLLSSYKQQSKIVETNIEGIVGLELLRQDVESAGYGLPWFGLPNYLEVASGGTHGDYADNFNDSPSGSPKAIVTGNNSATWTLNGSDYLVVKSVSVARNNVCQKWAYLNTDLTTNSWTPSSENLAGTDYVTAISPGTNDLNSRALVSIGTGSTAEFTRQFNAVSEFPADTVVRVVYGIRDGATAPRMPFNRADYYVRSPSDPSDLPRHCAPGTGILYKAIVEHGGGGFEYLPLLDCVVDMQVRFGVDTSDPPDGSVDGPWEDISGQSAEWIRNRVREVQIFILAQEGQYDRSYTTNQNLMTLADHTINLATIVGAGWQNYRWKVYTLILKPTNLR
jgi:prepilin-type N-terminal cleavage/methylation domain-containing protein